MPVPVQRAIKMVQAAHAHAAQLGIAVTATVVDEGGRVVALGRMDRARPMTLDLAVNKAFTAASFQMATHELGPLVNQSWFQSLVVANQGRVTPGGGAFPILEGANVLGAVGVAGGTDEQDQQCCHAALGKLGNEK